MTEPEKQIDLPNKKKEPPKIESAPAKLWKNENGEARWVLDAERCLQSHPNKLVTGIKDLELATNIITSALMAISPIVREEEATNIIIQSLHDFQPQNSIEARLVVQATVCHTYAMQNIRQSGKADMLSHIETMMNLGIKLLRVHNETIETLARYRRGGEQKVTVTHIAEKMAIVNNFGPQGGVVTKNQGDTPCQQYAERKQEPSDITCAANHPCPTEDAVYMGEKAPVRGQKKARKG